MKATTSPTSLSTGKKVLIFIACLAVPSLVGLFSSMLAGDIQGKYNALNMPPLAPPDFLFGIIWPVLYVLMGIALFLVVISRAPSARKITAISLFVAQLMVNYAWSPIFFRGSLWVGLAVIVLLDLLVFALISVFYRANKLAAVLVVPYALWILFATYLNLAFAILN